MNSKPFAVMATVGLVLFALGPGVATVGAQSTETLDVSVSQADTAAPTVSVTDNGTGVENASVTVEALDNGSYAGVGNDTTDENGTAELPAPEENVTVEVTATAGNVTASTTADLTAGATTEKESFGSVVSDFVQSLQDGETDTIGQQVATFVTENNPGNAPDDAGPPENAGPPANAGPSEDENETEEVGDEETEEIEDDEADDSDDDGSGGPPDNANGGGSDG